MSDSLAQHKWQSFPQTHKWILLTCLLALIAIATYYNFEERKHSPEHIAQTDDSTLNDTILLTESLPLLSEALLSEEEVDAEMATDTADELDFATNLKPLSLEYTVAAGDSLSTIFQHFRLGNHTLRAILEADEEILALDSLKEGTKLALTLDNSNFGQTLTSMEVFKNPAYSIVYRRVDDEHFAFQEKRAETYWEEHVYTGQINGSFFVSAAKTGLNPKEIQSAIDILKDKINFARQIQAGDRFEIVVLREVTDVEETGNVRIEGVRIHNRGKVVGAFLHDDGQYYNKNGQSLTSRAFRRFPTNREYRVSSHFNPNRRHPITGRVSPHNGTDFAAPIGTPVIATADGVVSRVRNHPYAGIYVEIEHAGGAFKTRYLHLSRAQVNKGQRVKSGQQIALSGNTGRSTGPHIHYEVHVNNRPVNALGNNVPLVTSIDKKSLSKFTSKVAALESKMAQHAESL
ncbi:MAG TPA: peptidoglycan DD-metalloendopeptidase family protein [Alcanivoracaceae bacterium]|nr:peptidoglycan DD-metalloendopeptidase family protein [Alcanivoracaceae bacterium]